MENLKKWFSQKGFKDIKVETSQVIFEFDSSKSFTRFHQQITALIHAILAKYTNEVKRHPWNAVTESVRQFSDPPGKVKLENDVICIAGRN